MVSESPHSSENSAATPVSKGPLILKNHLQTDYAELLLNEYAEMLSSGEKSGVEKLQHVAHTSPEKAFQIFLMVRPINPVVAQTLQMDTVLEKVVRELTQKLSKETRERLRDMFQATAWSLQYLGRQK